MSGRSVTTKHLSKPSEEEELRRAESAVSLKAKEGKSSRPAKNGSIPPLDLAVPTADGTSENASGKLLKSKTERDKKRPSTNSAHFHVRSRHAFERGIEKHRHPPKKPEFDKKFIFSQENIPLPVFRLKEAHVDTESKIKNLNSTEIEKRRLKIVNEILSTEVSYVSSLKRAVNEYHKPMELLVAGKKKEKIYVEKIRSVFGNMDNILRLNETLAEKLSQRTKTWTSETTLGDIFNEIGPYFKIYTEYGNNFDIAMENLTELSKKELFRKFTENKLNLSELLIAPIQRLPRYKLLLQDLLNYTPPTHKDIELLQASLAIIRSTVDHLNQSINRIKVSEKLMDEGYGHFLAPAREFVKDGNLEVTAVESKDGGDGKVGEYKFLLFNDILVHVFLVDKKTLEKRMAAGENKKNAKKRNRLTAVLTKEFKSSEDEWSWPLELTWLQDISFTEFMLIGPKKKITLKFENSTIKDQWYAILKTTIEAILINQPKYEESQTANGPELLQERSGLYTFHNGQKYSGTWMLGLPHGLGMISYLGTSFEGNFENGIRLDQPPGSASRQVVVTKPNQSLASQPSSRPLPSNPVPSAPPTQKEVSKLQYLEKTVYVGQLLGGKPDGYGESTSTSGSTYVGYWKAGLRDGTGDAVYPNGDYYVGEWKEGRRDGLGVFKSPSGCSYEGFWRLGSFSGYGKLEGKAGKYVGEFSHGLRNGPGVMNYKDGSVYDGEWKSDLWSGDGKYSNTDGVYTGKFLAGTQSGNGVMIYSDGAQYNGHWKEGKYYGKGTLTHPTSREKEYNGEWHSGLRNGKGVQIYSDGSCFDGHWKRNMPHGVGKWTMPDGVSSITGKWTYGVLEGRCVVETVDAGVSRSISVGDGVENELDLQYVLPEWVDGIQLNSVFANYQ
eukprot:TRINITY_DN8180_c0_g1_i1.p1 TRINITY_DN8180_c0_g1~~TRINITY_DN8180_c0_g1_i1.p1  ORF type:complete len:1041 (+),score=147.12 TRINITY_DN8180_c0_g1_i1:443-3124(+)